MLYPLQLDVATKHGVDDVVEHVRVLHLGLHDDLLTLGALRLHVVLPEVPLLLAGLAGGAAVSVIVFVGIVWNNFGKWIC